MAQPMDDLDLVIRTMARTIVDNADYFAFDIIVGHAARDVGVVVLDADLEEAFVERVSVLRREVFGVQVMCDRLGVKVKEPGAGAYPRERRKTISRPPARRVTESSARTCMRRS